MSTLTIRDLDPAIEDRLRARAARNGRSIEAESRAILAEAVVAPLPPPELNLYDQIRAHIEPLGGIDLDLPARTSAREPQGRAATGRHRNRCGACATDRGSR